MSKIYFEIEDDMVIKYTPVLEIGENTYKTEVVMTKEIFQECYKKWIEPQEKRDIEPPKISYTVEQELNEYTGNIEIIEKQY